MHTGCSHVSTFFDGLRNVWLADESHEDHWMTLLKQASDYSDLGCAVPGSELAEWILFHACDFKTIYDKHSSARQST